MTESKGRMSRRTTRAVDAATGDPLCQIEYTGTGTVELLLTVTHTEPGADRNPANNTKSTTATVVP